MATHSSGDQARENDAAPVRVHSCSRIGLQATPPGRRLRFGGRRAV